MGWRRRNQPPPLALKIDVDTWRGTREGVPALLALLEKFDARATFLFSLGPDHTGRAVRRALRPGFMKKVGRTSVLEHYGIKTLLYGTLLPGPDIGRKGAQVMRAVAAAGHETGIHTWDHVRWQDGVEGADADWTRREMSLAMMRYEQIFGTAARTHGAAGWQMNRHALRLTQSLGMDYCSDARGRAPFVPVMNAEIVACPQLPTTLPTLDELIGLDGCTPDNVHERLLALTEEAPLHGHVYTLHAELEGGKLAPVFERLLAGWRDQGYTLSTTRALFEQLDVETLPRCEILRGEVPGRSGTLMVQGAEFLA
ncbi:MAG: 4-deoxy-4-formamido-L-arabinose-phosphoundecaprenol deformylase [Rhodocyclaceae bacterium]|nr:4-deoxy-4-formamido-L-arabinose-phosphoundecaprenol deformylase [Rhodocyclaceae bacterium]MBX3668612.1 4-deoxy-4-formamido-L-arabinose-phosphoundecaprenol deformylase [Rhodocyclaceae bacterium]